MNTPKSLRFPSGASVESIKKTARRLVRDNPGLTHTAALNRLAREHGLDMDWDEALTTLEKRPTPSGTPATETSGAAGLAALLASAASTGASAIHLRFKDGASPTVLHRVNTELQPADTLPASAAQELVEYALVTLCGQSLAEVRKPSIVFGVVRDPAVLPRGIAFA